MKTYVIKAGIIGTNNHLNGGGEGFGVIESDVTYTLLAIGESHAVLLVEDDDEETDRAED